MNRITMTWLADVAMWSLVTWLLWEAQYMIPFVLCGTFAVIYNGKNLRMLVGMYRMKKMMERHMADEMRNEERYEMYDNLDDMDMDNYEEMDDHDIDEMKADMEERRRQEDGE